MKKNEIIFNSVIFGFMVNGEAIGVEFHNEGKGKVNGQTYGNTYEVKIKYNKHLYTFKTSAYANKTNAKRFIQDIIKTEEINLDTAMYAAHLK